LQGTLEPVPSIELDMPDSNCFVFAEHDGLIEPLADLGDDVRQGEALAQIWPTDRTGMPPTTYAAKRDGILAARHFPGLVKAGDCMAVVAEVCA